MAKVLTATIEKRYTESGFVLVNQTRMLFAPARGNRHGYPQDEETLLLSEANWGKPTEREVQACREALQKAYPDRKILITD